MIKAKLNDNYDNDFIAIQMGQIFYRKDNKLGKEAGYQLIDENNKEIMGLINQGILVVEKDVQLEVTTETPIASETKSISDTLKKDVMKENNKIVKDNLFEETIKEIKTESNDEELSK